MKKKATKYVITYSELLEKTVKTKDIKKYLKRLNAYQVHTVIDLKKCQRVRI